MFLLAVLGVVILAYARGCEAPSPGGGGHEGSTVALRTAPAGRGTVRTIKGVEKAGEIGIEVGRVQPPATM